MKPSAYERRAIEEIHRWKHPKKGWFGTAVDIVSRPLDAAGDLFTKIPGVGWVLEKSIGGVVGLLNDAAQWSVRHEAVFSEYRGDGHTVHRHDHIFELDLEQVDKTVGRLAAKYKVLAAAEGAASGTLGAPGIPIDVVAIVLLNLRAIGEYATYFGFDPTLQQESLFAMNVLGFASSPTDRGKQAAMAQLVRIAQEVASRKTWKELQKHAFVQVVQQIAKALGIRLTKAKLAQLIPVLSVGVGAGFNAYFTAKVCEAAYMLYRERFLAQKYGADVIDVSVEPAEDFVPDYPERHESLPPAGTPPSATV